MSGTEAFDDEDISLFDLWEKLRRGWLWVAGAAAIGVLGAGLATALIPPKFEAVAIVQVGQVGQVDQLGQVTSQPVESATEAVERMKTPAFQIRVAEGAGLQKWIGDLRGASSGTAAYLSLQVIKGTTVQGTRSLIELKAKGESADAAKEIAAASVLELARKHAEIAKLTIEGMRLGLTIAKERLANAENEVENINKLMASAGVKDDRFTQLSLMTSLRVQKVAELFSQRQMIMAVETALSAPATQPAQAIEAVFVSENPVSPKKMLLFAVGFFGGLFVGVMMVFISGAWRQARERSLASRSERWVVGPSAGISAASLGATQMEIRDSLHMGANV